MILAGLAGLVVGFVIGFLVFRNNVAKMKQVEADLRSKISKKEKDLKDAVQELKDKL